MGSLQLVVLLTPTDVDVVNLSLAVIDQLDNMDHTTALVYKNRVVDFIIIIDVRSLGNGAEFIYFSLASSKDLESTLPDATDLSQGSSSSSRSFGRNATEPRSLLRDSRLSNNTGLLNCDDLLGNLLFIKDGNILLLGGCRGGRSRSRSRSLGFDGIVFRNLGFLLAHNGYLSLSFIHHLFNNLSFFNGLILCLHIDESTYRSMQDTVSQK
ncbi:hypothetical protein BCR41DRAFT_176132 [Lobosporangium transversale]|uniref:Uncharacterized protein n=1 Tax=Lobosporangium transversale TaxID=64571 RepID=A0A1Y2GAP7_9FUNG|nr:hypothetical protein BCR41DRAFT_176132 [Lobosporangium transversale]ORZ05711.1 hypothetical protein BCR41DRAFT_176132 [Lobosporangium transversale]|eukprot:XP_021877198.1 hypothetical protein BCR41DRAFT_176132 [Lobosporangium transversale]